MNATQLQAEFTQQIQNDPVARQQQTELQAWIGHAVDLWDAASRGKLDGHLGIGEAICEATPALSELFRSGQPDFIAESEPVLIAALPLTYLPDRQWVAVFPVLARPLDDADDKTAISELLGLEPSAVDRWAERQTLCSPEVACRLGVAFLVAKERERCNDELTDHLEATSDRLSSTLEELSLFHRLTQNLSASSSNEELGQQAIEWMLEYLPASGCGLHLLPSAEENHTAYDIRSVPKLLRTGHFPLTLEMLERVISQAVVRPLLRPQVILASEASILANIPHVREILLADVRDRSQTFGHLVLLNRIENPPFAVKDSNLLASVSAILGTHCGNHELYRQQESLVTNVVRSLTSAIDAKDRYTLGHSDRVARIALRLARELSCSDDELHTIYLAGLLHDIGKIGISDEVLQKEGGLTPAEFEHIKQHPGLGCNILKDIRQLDHVLPVVRHHHEQWNGNGYPSGLNQEEIPLLARIVGVADAFDAMTSSRCYRNGMPLDKVEQILRNGAGIQWDPAVINAYFLARQDLLAITQDERQNLTIDVRPKT